MFYVGFFLYFVAAASQFLPPANALTHIELWKELNEKNGQVDEQIIVGHFFAATIVDLYARKSQNERSKLLTSCTIFYDFTFT